MTKREGNGISLKMHDAKTKYFTLISLFILSMGCASTTSTRLSIPEWYGKSVSNADYFYFYGEGNSLANAKLLAFSDLNQQLLSDVKSATSYKISTSDNQASRQSYSTVSSIGVEVPIPLPQWEDTQILADNIYVKGRLSTKNLVEHLKNIISDDIDSMDFERQSTLSISHYLYFEKNKAAAKRAKSLIHLLSLLCSEACDLAKFYQWETSYEELLSFPSRHCIYIRQSTSPELTSALKTYFIQQGFTGRTQPCLEVSADFTPKYQRKNNYKWAEGWLKFSISSKHASPVVGRSYLIGKSEHSYKLAFHNSLDSLNKNGLFSSLQK